MGETGYKTNVRINTKLQKRNIENKKLIGIFIFVVTTNLRFFRFTNVFKIVIFTVKKSKNIIKN